MPWILLAFLLYLFGAFKMTVGMVALIQGNDELARQLLFQGVVYSVLARLLHNSERRH